MLVFATLPFSLKFSARLGFPRLFIFQAGICLSRIQVGLKKEFMKTEGTEPKVCYRSIGMSDVYVRSFNDQFAELSNMYEEIKTVVCEADNAKGEKLRQQAARAYSRMQQATDGTQRGV